MPEQLFPDVPEDIKGLNDTELGDLIDQHVQAAALIEKDDAEFLAGYEGEEGANQIIEQMKQGKEQIIALRAEQKERAQAHENFKAEKDGLLEAFAEPEAEVNAEGEDAGDEDDSAEDEEDAKAEVVAEATPEPEAEVVEEEKVPVVASAPRFSRTPPAPARERIVVETVEEQAGPALVASAQFKAQQPDPLGPDTLANLMRDVANDMGPSHDGKGAFSQKVDAWQVDHYADGRQVTHGGGMIHWDGPKTKVAGSTFDFPDERTLTGGDDDFDKIRAALPPTVAVNGKAGTMSQEALVASGGICAPSTPFYNLVNFATEAEPVWDALPVFRAARGGVNVPDSSYIADITTAISSISEANDALGGTFATKSCQDLTCPAYTETFVNIFAHCREYGNLNARTWPETFMLDRIKALSVNVTNGAETLGALIYLVDAIVKARFGIIGRFRMPRTAQFRALLPYWVPSMLALDNVQTQFDRFRTEGSLVEYLRSHNIEPTFYLDSPSTGTTQLPDASQTAAALDPLPDNVQWAIFPEGAFVGIDSGSLELGIVRDSTLNSTNDFQVFGERFRNLFRLAPAQAAYWVTSDLCANGQFPPAGTARTCD